MKEIWKDAVGYENCYQVSNIGRVRCIIIRDKRGIRSEIGNIVPPFENNNGYLLVAVSKDSKQIKRYVHHLVIEAFIGPCPPGMQVNHLNGNKKENRPGNLEYVTSSQNHYHSYRVLGKKAARGEKQGQAKLTEENVRFIRLAYANKTHTNIALAKMFQVSESVISHVVHRKSWQHI